MGLIVRDTSTGPLEASMWVPVEQTVSLPPPDDLRFALRGPVSGANRTRRQMRAGYGRPLPGLVQKDKSRCRDLTLSLFPSIAKSLTATARSFTAAGSSRPVMFGFSAGRARIHASSSASTKGLRLLPPIGRAAWAASLRVPLRPPDRR